MCVALWTLIDSPSGWLGVASAFVMIVFGWQFVYTGITDRWGHWPGSDASNRRSRRERFIAVDPVPTESQHDDVGDAAVRSADPSGNSLNPYDPPRGLDDPYDPPRVLVDSQVGLLAELFQAGQPFIHYGVVYFVENGDMSAIHAALPLADASQEGISRNVQEAVRVLPEFLASIPSLKQRPRDGQLIIRMIASYDDLNDEVADRVIQAFSV